MSRGRREPDRGGDGGLGRGGRGLHGWPGPGRLGPRAEGRPPAERAALLRRARSPRGHDRGRDAAAPRAGEARLPGRRRHGRPRRRGRNRPAARPGGPRAAAPDLPGRGDAGRRRPRDRARRRPPTTGNGAVVRRERLGGRGGVPGRDVLAAGGLRDPVDPLAGRGAQPRSRRPFEPHVPWRADVLRFRARCYAATRDPRASRARAELEEYVQGEPKAPTGGGGPLATPVPRTE